MTMRWTLTGLAVLALAWAGPLPGLVPQSFTAHMLLHMAVVGIGVPLIAAGLARAAGRTRLANAQLALPLFVSFADLIVVWGWHAPALHMAARTSGWALAAEQASFALVSLLVWLVALASAEGRRREAALSGALALFFTSMHMTLLGGLIAQSRQPVFAHDTVAHGGAHSALWGLDPLSDQQLGGAIMLVIGGVIYLSGALVLIARVLKGEEAA